MISICVLAVVVDHVKVFGYTAWSLVDGFEWNSGYSIRRGLFYIDFNNPECTRVPKSTAQYYRQIIKDNGFLTNETERYIEGHFPCDFQFGVADYILQVRKMRGEKKESIFQCISHINHITRCYHIFNFNWYFCHSP